MCRRGQGIPRTVQALTRRQVGGQHPGFGHKVRTNAMLQYYNLFNMISTLEAHVKCNSAQGDLARQDSTFGLDFKTWESKPATQALAHSARDISEHCLVHICLTRYSYIWHVLYGLRPHNLMSRLPASRCIAMSVTKVLQKLELCLGMKTILHTKAFVGVQETLLDVCV
jgi:hypothetical protein